MTKKQSAREFILQQSSELTTKQVVEAGAAAGLKFGPRRVQEVRKELKDKTSAPRSSKNGKRKAYLFQLDDPKEVVRLAARSATKTVTHVPMRYMASLNQIHVPTPMTITHDDSLLMALIMEKGINRCNELVERLQTLARNANV